MNNLFVIYSYVLRIKSPANKPFFFKSRGIMFQDGFT